MKELLKAAKHLLVGGHRGCICEYPENSILAMEEGIRRGADYLEIDVQLTKDDVPVVFHDTCLGDRTSLTGYVHEVTYTQLKESIPELCTLEEAMRWGAAHDVWFGLEIKTVPLDMQKYNLRLVKKITSILHKTGMTERIFVFGQDYQVLQYLYEFDPSVILGLIVPFVPIDPAGLMREMHATIYLSYIYNITPVIIQQLHENGFYVSGAILRDEHWIKRARFLGVDMFESDYPEKYSLSH